MFVGFSLPNIVALLFFITSVCYVGTAIITITSNTRTKLKWEALLVNIFLAFACVSYGLMANAQNETLARIFWASGYFTCLVSLPLWIRFVSNMSTIRHKLTRFSIRWLLAIITAVIAFICVFFGNVTFVESTYGMEFFYPESLLFRGVALFVTLMYICVFILHIKWWREEDTKRHRRQQMVFILLVIAFTPLGYVTDFILPAFTNFHLPPLISVLLFPIYLFIILSMRKSNTLSVSLQSVAQYIYKTTSMPTIVLNYKNIVYLENDAATNLMGSKIIGENFSKYILINGKNPRQSFFFDNYENNNIDILTDKGIKTCMMQLIVEKDKYDDALCKIITLVDITDERKALKERELQLTKLGLMTKATKIALWDMNIIGGDKVNPVNPTNEFIYSQEFRHALGYSDENDFPNVLESWSNLLHPDDKEGILNDFRTHMLDKTGKTPYDVEYRLLTKDGEYRYFHASGETIRDTEGNPIHVAGAILDINDSKYAQERIRLMLDSSPLCCEIWDRNLKLLDCNEATVRFVGVESKEEFLKGIFNFSPEYQPDGQRSEEKTLISIEKAFKEGRFTIDWQHILLDGTLVPTEVTLVPIKYGDDDAVIAYTRDLREHYEMMENIEYREALLQAVNQAAAFLLESNEESFNDNMYKALEIIGKTADVDRMFVWKNHTIDDLLYSNKTSNFFYCKKHQQI
ncbi:MAG: PAS domain-containing protein [Oscillospiraceae bacterium]|jgi:PAS domain S-box-containing protein|nr:PAS domain-containing protein [Oscillospiraceae bacterium]